MKRMTTRVYGKSSLVKGVSIFDIKEAVDRLAAIKDILGDEYDLDELREMVQAKREGRCVVLPRLEPGHGDNPGAPGVPGPPGIAD